MNINELEKLQLNRGLAYTLGLIYPLYKEKKVKGKEYILGAVNHNSGKVTQDELNEHFKEVYDLLDTSMGDDAPQLSSNRTVDYVLTPKQGFTVLIEKTGVDTDKCLSILTQKVNEVKNSSKEIQKEFITGCFDGRSSWDTTAHFLSIDVDRDYQRQDLIVDIITNSGININVNRRDKDHKKNDQIRIKGVSVNDFMRRIGLYSACRKKQVENGLSKL